jgi:integrase
MLVSSGLNIKAVSSRLGHANVGITLDLYAHAQREDDEKAAAIIGQIMAAPAPRMDEQVANL